MKCDTLSALKLWVVRKKGCKKTGNRMTKSGAEIIQDDFRPLACHTTMFLQWKWINECHLSGKGNFIMLGRCTVIEMM